MHLRYDDDFLEAAVFLVASGKREGVPSLQIHRFHLERERCYDVVDPDARNAAFFKLHLDWFREWRLEERLLGMLKKYPLLPPALATLAFRKVRMKKDEAAELYVSAENGRSAIVAMRSERFERDESVAGLLDHEFMHLSDMVDPAFDYSPMLNVTGLNPTLQRITRERYRILWDITIDGRLFHAARSPSKREHHEALFNRAFSFWPETRRAQVFESHWNEAAPRHQDLLAIAADPRDLSHVHPPLPGSLCPLCQFPTFDWATEKRLTLELRDTLQQNFPNWSADQGVCQRCVEVYELQGKVEMPATICL